MRFLCWVWLPLSLMSLHGTPLKAEALRWQWTVGEVYNIKFTSNVALAVSSDSDKLNYQNEIIIAGQWTVAEVNSSGIAHLHFDDWPSDSSDAKSASIDNPHMLKRIGKMTGSMFFNRPIHV